MRSVSRCQSYTRSQRDPWATFGRGSQTRSYKSAANSNKRGVQTFVVAHSYYNGQHVSRRSVRYGDRIIVKPSDKFYQPDATQHFNSDLYNPAEPDQRLKVMVFHKFYTVSKNCRIPQVLTIGGESGVFGERRTFYRNLSQNNFIKRTRDTPTRSNFPTLALRKIRNAEVSIDIFAKNKYRTNFTCA